MAIKLLSVTGVTGNLWLYVLSAFLFLAVCFLLFQNFWLRKSVSADDDYHCFLFEILDDPPFPIMAKDIRERFKHTCQNKEAELQSGISHKDAVGFSDAGIFGKERGKQYRRIDGNLVKTGKPYKAEERYVTAGGKVHDTPAVKSIISSGKPGKWLLVARQEIIQLKMYGGELLATRKQLEGAIHKQKSVLRSIGSGLIYIDRNYKVQQEETSNIKNLAVGCYYIPGITCYRTTGRGDKPCKRYAFQETIGTGRMMGHVIHADHIDFGITATPVYSDTGGETTGGLLRFEDITEKLKVDRVLQEVKEKAGESNRLKSALLANMSHEIRTPLNTIVGFSDLICQTDDTEEKKEYTWIVISNSEFLLQPIDDIPGLSKIETGTMDFSRALTDVNELMEDACLRMQQENRRPRIQILFTEEEPCCVINMDRLRSSRVIINLMNNAVKFTAEDSITLGYRPNRQKNELYFFVKNAGIDIPVDKVEEVFERFVKLNSFVKDTGLGLAICRVIIERLGGTIGVDITVEESACFRFRLSVQEDIPFDIPINLC